MVRAKEREKAKNNGELNYKMIRKLIIIMAFVIGVVIIADYYGVITLPSFERSAVLDNRDQMIFKTKKELEDQ